MNPTTPVLSLINYKSKLQREIILAESLPPLPFNPEFIRETINEELSSATVGKPGLKIICKEGIYTISDCMGYLCWTADPEEVLYLIDYESRHGYQSCRAAIDKKYIPFRLEKIEEIGERLKGRKSQPKPTTNLPSIDDLEIEL